MRTDTFDFDLPVGFIAQRPAEPRDSARLLMVDAGRTGTAELGDRAVRDLPDLLDAGDLMVFNDTRVIPVRLAGRRGGARVEVTLHKEAGQGLWRAFARPARKLRPGDAIDFAPGFQATVAARGTGGEVTLEFAGTKRDLMAALDAHGVMPIPPYIKRTALADDRDAHDYQTMFAERPGAVAAPTAALHFTPALMAALDARGIGHAMITLHVGAGTYLPVTAERTEDHEMHAEWGEVGARAADAVNAARARGGRVVAVGSTVLRLLEAAADETGRVHPFTGETDIFITPGARLGAADMMMTNFHLPRSTLFMLVSAFAGTARMKRAYEHAKRAGYRFYSYGDACLLTRARDGADE